VSNSCAEKGFLSSDSVLTSTIETSQFTVKSFEESADASVLSFCDDVNLHIAAGLFKLRVSIKVTSKRISQANYFYRTSISRITTHPQY